VLGLPSLSDSKVSQSNENFSPISDKQQKTGQNKYHHTGQYFFLIISLLHHLLIPKFQKIIFSKREILRKWPYTAANQIS